MKNLYKKMKLLTKVVTDSGRYHGITGAIYNFKTKLLATNGHYVLELKTEQSDTEQLPDRFLALDAEKLKKHTYTQEKTVAYKAEGFVTENTNAANLEDVNTTLKPYLGEFKSDTYIYLSLPYLKEVLAILEGETRDQNIVKIEFERNKEGEFLRDPVKISNELGQAILMPINPTGK